MRFSLDAGAAAEMQAVRSQLDAKRSNVPRPHGSPRSGRRVSNFPGISVSRRVSRGLLALALPLLLEGTSVAVTTSIAFDDTGFRVASVWTGSSLGIPVSPDPACVITNTCTNLGGILFSPDGNTLYVVAAADTTTSALYAVSVTRSTTTNEVINLVGPASKVFDANSPAAGTGLDAGWQFGPSGTLFYSYFPANVLAERVGANEMQFNLNSLKVPSSIAGLAFSPFRVDQGTAFGTLQINTGFGRNVYELALTPTSGGFFAPVAKTLFATLANGSLGNMQYIPSAPFAGDLMYVAFNAGELHIVAIDPATGLAVDSTTGRPTLGTANPVDMRFARGFGSDTTAGPFGLEFDPRNNDMFVSTFEGDSSVFNSIIQIQGFSHVTTTTSTVPPPTTTSTTATTTTVPQTTTTTTIQPTTCGDVNGDGVVDVGDALIVAQFEVALRSCGQSPFTHPDLCDVNNDGSCNIGDALRIAQCDVGLISCSFTCKPFQCP